MARLDLDRHVVLELRAVGDVQVDDGQRVPFVHQPQHRLHLGRVGLRVVAVQVVVLRRGAPAHLLRAALVRPVPRAEPLVPVDVEHGHEQQHLLAERARQHAPFEQLAQDEEAGILAVDLARMDAALHQQHRQVFLACRARIERAAGRGDEREHRPPFRRAAELDAAHRLRMRALEGAAQRDDLVVATGDLEARSLGDRAQRVGGMRGGGHGKQCGKQQRPHRQ